MRVTVRRPPWGILVVIALVLFQTWSGLHDARGVYDDTTVAHRGAVALAICQMTTAFIGMPLAYVLWQRARRYANLIVAWGGVLTLQGTIAASLYSPAEARWASGAAAFGSVLIVVGPIAYFTRRWMRAAPADAPHTPAAAA